MVGKRIKKLRVARGLTQIELASLLGVTHPLISMIERDKVKPNARMVRRLGDIFKVPVFLVDPDIELSFLGRELLKREVKKG